MRTKDNPLVGYFFYNDALYRIKVFETTIWIERQTPRAFAGNIQMDIPPEGIVYGEETWKLAALPDILDHYEELLTQE